MTYRKESRAVPIAKRDRHTGPRTTAGKLRSRFNALKSGIFSKLVLLPNESRAELDSWLTGFKECFQPEGAVEECLVVDLAMIEFRKRRIVVAESAEIAKSHRFSILESLETQIVEAWDVSRYGESKGGMLRYGQNAFVIGEVLSELKAFRVFFAEHGFKAVPHQWLFQKIYGLDHDGRPPLGFFRFYMMLSNMATEASNDPEKPAGPEELKEIMLGALDKEIVRLENLEAYRREKETERQELQQTAAVIPPERVMDGIIRYEGHLSREFSRILTNLERLQRIRKGQTVPPPIKLDISV